MRKIKFTKATLDALPVPEKGRVRWQDEKTPGLFIRVSPTGTKTFIIYHRVSTRPVTVTLGRYPAMTIDQARRQAAKIMSELLEGKDPNEAKRRDRSVMTLAQAFNLYLEQHAKPHTKTWPKEQQPFEKYVTLKSPHVTKITRDDIRALHARIGRDHGHYMANRVLQLLSAVFNWHELPNPCKGVRKFKEEKRDRFLRPEEVKRFFEALVGEPLADYFMLCLLTGARRSDVCAMCWEDIHLEGATWTVPDPKVERYTVPLVPEAVEILKARREWTASEWVFPSRSKSGHLEEPKRAWRRVLDKAGIEDLRIHDLRRTLGSWQAGVGANLVTIGKALGHKNINSTMIYARLDLDPVRQSIQAATRAMLAAAGQGDEAEVVDLKKRSPKRK